MGEHIRYNTNTSMATYLIGSTAIRYEYLDQILPPIVDKIQENEKLIFHVDLEGIIYGLYRKSNLPQLHAMEFDILVKDITVGVINVLAHYRQYFATRLGMDHEILVYWNYELPAYQKEYCREYRKKTYDKYDPANRDFGVIYQATRKAVKMIANLLDGIEVRLNTDYLENKAALDALADKVVYTGPIDAYFDYKLGTLEYRSVRFENELLDKPSFQGNAAVNYTDRETPWTRIIEHKWFEFGKDENGNDLPKTIISREYSSEWKPGDEPYYPVNDAKNGALYAEYKKLADAETKVIFGGRLGEYKYYDMDQVIAAVLDRCEAELA